SARRRLNRSMSATSRSGLPSLLAVTSRYPLLLSNSSAPFVMLAYRELRMSEKMNPIIREDDARMFCAAMFGLHPSSSMAVWTFWKTEGFTPGTLLMARDTVPIDTPARSATACRVPRDAGGVDDGFFARDMLMLQMR